MLTLTEIMKSVLEIREAVNTLQVKGKENAGLIVYADSKCESLIASIRKTVEDLSKNQNGVEEVDEKANANNSDLITTD